MKNSKYLGQIEVNNGYNGDKAIAHIVNYDNIILEVYDYGYIACMRNFVLDGQLYILSKMVFGSVKNAVQYTMELTGFNKERCENIVSLGVFNINPKLLKSSK